MPSSDNDNATSYNWMNNQISRSLMTVKEAGQLGYILKFQINPLFKLLSSAIICGAERNEYLFYYAPDDVLPSVATVNEKRVPDVINAGRHSYLFNYFQKKVDTEAISTFDITKYGDKENIHPYFLSFQQKGITEVTVINLAHANEVVGYWLLVFEKDVKQADFKAGKFERLAEELGNAVYSINIHGRLNGHLTETEILQALNTDLAATRDKRSLLGLIRSKLIKLFKFSHHFIVKVNDDELTASLMLTDSQSKAQYHPLYDTLTTLKAPIADGVWNKVLLSSEPVVLDLDKMAGRGPLPIYLQVNYDSGIKNVLMLALRVDSRVVGMWAICFTHDQQILPKHIELVKTVAAPISVAVANIRISESLRERDAERDRMMELSFDLTTIRSAVELQTTLEQYLHKLFNFQSVSIFAEYGENQHIPFLYFSKENSTNSEFFKGQIIQGIAVDNYHEIFGIQDVQVVDIEKLIFTIQPSVFLNAAQQDGIKTVVGIPLRNGNKRIGLFFLYLRADMQLAERQLNIFKEISYQVGKAVSNIWVIEELARRENEKQLLLTLSEDIAGVRDKEQLTSLIKRRLKPVLGFAHFALCVKTADNAIVPFLADPESKAKEHPQYKSVFRQNIDEVADFINYVDQSSVPVIINKNHKPDFKDLPFALQVNFESGIEEIVIAKLSDGTSFFGYWFLCYETGGAINISLFSLLQGIANQFSTAMFNIQANLEIIEREREKELLVSLSKTTAGLRSFEQLLEVVSSKFKGFFAFEECFIGIVNNDGITFNILLPQNRQIQDHQLNNKTLNPKAYEALWAAMGPLVIDLDEEGCVLFKLFNSHRTYQKAVLTKFMHGDKLLGIWVMFYKNEASIDKNMFGLLEGVNDQLSIAVANIIANEQLAHNEWRKSMLLNFSTQVSQARDPAALVGILRVELKEVLRFSHSSIVLLNEDKTAAMPWVVPSESKSSGHPDYQKIVQLTPVNDGVANVALAADKPQFTDIAEFAKTNQMPLYMDVSFQCGMTHVVFVKLMVNHEPLGFWVIWYDAKPCDSEQYTTLLEEIAGVLSITIFNISANEKINKQEREKSALLDFTTAIAGVKEKFELQKIFNRYLQNLCLIEDICLHWIAEDKSTHYCYFWKGHDNNTNPDFNSIVTTLYPVTDPVFTEVFESGDAVKFDVKQLQVMPNAPRYVKLLADNSFINVIGVPLYKGDEMVGLLFVNEFDTQTADLQIFKGLCSQLAIAVSNLVANEKVLQQLAEINSYKERLEEEKIYLKQELETTHNYSEIIGESAEIEHVLQMVTQVSAADSTVLILGETGTGKELIARAIHNNSPRRSKLMVKVNCAALPANLIESELFGHERGSFTGATERRIGKFELASGGTLFLDEIGELPLKLQVKLLRALQEREIERIGGKETIKVDVRIVTATNRNLEEEIREGRFRSDLYFRLSTFPILLPSLKERRQDIPLLAMHFVSRFAKKTGKAIDTISNKAMQALVGYDWPGNIRELEHLVERSVLMAQGNTIKNVDIPATSINTNAGVGEEPVAAIKTIDENERELIIRTLKHCQGRISGAKGAAELLGVPSTTLNAKIKRLGIKKNFLR